MLVLHCCTIFCMQYPHRAATSHYSDRMSPADRCYDLLACVHPLRVRLLGAAQTYCSCAVYDQSHNAATGTAGQRTGISTAPAADKTLVADKYISSALFGLFSTHMLIHGCGSAQQQQHGWGNTEMAAGVRLGQVYPNMMGRSIERTPLPEIPK